METAVRQEDTPPKASRVPRRGLLAAAAWAAPTLAVATAAPAIAASPSDLLANLAVGTLGGAEGRYATGGNFTDGGGASNTDFRRAFSVTNNSTVDFDGSLRIDFTFPRMWNQALGPGNDTGAFDNYGTKDLGGIDGGSIDGGASAWTVTGQGDFAQNTGNFAWTAVYLRNDPAFFTLQDVSLPSGAMIWFALNASVPYAWIGAEGSNYINPGNENNRIYWKSEVDITATTTGGDELGPYRTDVGSWPEGIWYFNGGGPFAFDGGQGLYPEYGEG